MALLMSDFPSGPTQMGCQSCRQLHQDIRFSVEQITDRLDRFFIRIESLVVNKQVPRNVDDSRVNIGSNHDCDQSTVRMADNPQQDNINGIVSAIAKCTTTNSNALNQALMPTPTTPTVIVSGSRKRKPTRRRVRKVVNVGDDCVESQAGQRLCFECRCPLPTIEHGPLCSGCEKSTQIWQQEHANDENATLKMEPVDDQVEAGGFDFDISEHDEQSAVTMNANECEQQCQAVQSISVCSDRNFHPNVPSHPGYLNQSPNSGHFPTPTARSSKVVSIADSSPSGLMAAAGLNSAYLNSLVSANLMQGLPSHELMHLIQQQQQQQQLPHLGPTSSSPSNGIYKTEELEMSRPVHMRKDFIQTRFRRRNRDTAASSSTASQLAATGVDPPSLSLFSMLSPQFPFGFNQPIGESAVDNGTFERSN